MHNADTALLRLVSSSFSLSLSRRSSLSPVNPANPFTFSSPSVPVLQPKSSLCFIRARLFSYYSEPPGDKLVLQKYHRCSRQGQGTAQIKTRRAPPLPPFPPREARAKGSPTTEHVKLHMAFCLQLHCFDAAQNANNLALPVQPMCLLSDATICHLTSSPQPTFMVPPKGATPRARCPDTEPDLSDHASHPCLGPVGKPTRVGAALFVFSTPDETGTRPLQPTSMRNAWPALRKKENTTDDSRRC
ncbi:hypothetical protein CFRS1_v010445 [Colletotrichum fructicola]|nr:hypothetical protein CFRS1_v010445 [Colletotrichum fructicola]